MDEKEAEQRTERAHRYREAYEQGRFDLKMDLLASITELVDNNDGSGASVKDVLVKIAYVE